MTNVLNPFTALDSIKDSYRNYVSSFQEFKNPVIKDWVEDRIRDENLLYKGPFIQLNRRFQKGDPFDLLVGEGLLHRGTSSLFSADLAVTSAPVTLHRHQSEAIRAIAAGTNTIIATGTGSGKSFCFGIPVISTCLRMRDQGVAGVKAIFVYPMNALANSQYDDFARRLQGTGLTIALYTGDTPKTKEEGRQECRTRNGRDPYDSELLSREEIQRTPPDILITNYVMLEYILTRFEDRVLFPLENRGVLQYLVLDEIHTYTGKKGADVAYLVRRLKQSTGTKGALRCIGTSATVQDTGDTSSAEAITRFAQELFGERFDAGAVVGETYVALPHDADALLSATVQITEDMLANFEDTDEHVGRLISALTGEPLPASTMDRTSLGAYLGKQRTVQFLETRLQEDIAAVSELVEEYGAQVRPGATRRECERELTAALLAGMHTKVEINGTLQARMVPKAHTFFSQGRDIKSCISRGAPHPNDAGEVTCPHCGRDGRTYHTFPLVFCRSCGQEYYSVEILSDGTLIPHELGEEETDDGNAAYLYLGHIGIDRDDLPESWITDKTGEIKKKYGDSLTYEQALYCPSCNKLYHGTERETGACICSDKVEVTIIPSPLRYCPSPSCGIYYDMRTRSEFNKLFSFRTVGRSTATDILVSSILDTLPEREKKIIAFSDNRQDTALQAAHINNMQRRIHFRRAMYHALKDLDEPVPLTDLGDKIYAVLQQEGALPAFAEEDKYGDSSTSKHEEDTYKKYLLYNAFLELGATRQKTQPNLEDMGLLKVTYHGMDKIAQDTKDLWGDVPELLQLSDAEREDYLTGFLDIMRYNLAIDYEYFLDLQDFNRKVVSQLDPGVLFHNEENARKPTGYSDEANRESRDARVFRFASANGNLVKWTKRVFDISDNEVATRIVSHVAETLPKTKRLVDRDIKYVGKIWSIDHGKIRVSVPKDSTHRVCKKCGKVHHFKTLSCCTGPTCAGLMEKELSSKYFFKAYTSLLPEATYIRAEEHSGQIDGNTRKDLEVRFREKGDVNVIVCTPTMELGIDIGSLSAVYMRNVPPSPSNYAQRAGRAGRKSQASLIATFCGVGMKRGPHDQYFYRYPKSIISGKISAPRFMLNNESLVRAHIHSLIIESLSLKIPQKLNQILDLENKPALPMFTDITQDIGDELIDKAAIEGMVSDGGSKVLENIFAALEQEMVSFGWLTESYVKGILDSFVTDLDKAFNPFRQEYREICAELGYLDVSIRSSKTDEYKRKTYQSRRESLEAKIQNIESGSHEYSTYSYLGQHGFIPNYGFPTLTTKLSLHRRANRRNEEVDLTRDQTRALREYAPQNTVYYRGDRYVVAEARIKTVDTHLVTSKLLLCPHCGIAYLDEEIVAAGGCCTYCGADISHETPYRNAVQMPDQRAERRTSITSDEEERTRLGYDISPHYRRSTAIEGYDAVVDGSAVAKLCYDHKGRILLVNRGPLSRNGENDTNGFILCTRCNRWISSKNKLKDHLGEKGKDKCWKNAIQEDIVESIVLYTESLHDVVTIDCDVPEAIAEGDYESFYASLSEAIMQSLQIAMNVDTDELESFLMPHPDDDKRSVIVIYETAEGGAGILRALTETDTFRAVIAQARTILHEHDGPDTACQKACYLCLCNYYNQRLHDKLDRTLVLPSLRELSNASITKTAATSSVGEMFERLYNACDSSFEKQVLTRMRDLGMRLPDEAQYIIRDKDAIIAKPDFAYTKDGLSIVVFVDGPDHDKESVRHDDKAKRGRLDLMGWHVVVIRYDDDVDTKLNTLSTIIG